jgi:hypothetical protein
MQLSIVSYLEVEGERRVAEVDGVELQVLDVEGRLGRVEREVDDEHDEANQDGERQDAGGDGAAAPPQDPVAVVLLLAHGEQDQTKPEDLQLRCWWWTDELRLWAVGRFGAGGMRRPF